jgi:glycoside/pentoside/hexuronide:cation symporter, GPH family
MLFAGGGLGLTFVAPWSMVPDAVEWDAVRTGKRKEGVYYGMWTFFSKCGQALSIGVSGLILGMSGYVADAVQTTSTLFAIKCLIGPLPAVVFVVGIVILSRYPITEKTYNEMMGKAQGSTRLTPVP